MVQTVFGVSGDTGVNVINVLPLERAIAPGIRVLPRRTWKPATALITLSGWLNWAATREFTGTPVAPLAGLTATPPARSWARRKTGGCPEQLRAEPGFLTAKSP